MNGAKNKCKSKSQKHRLHLVIICDETGIFDAFELIKNHLAYREKTFLSLIYILSANDVHPLFERELSILEKRYPHTLLLKYILQVDAAKNCFIQEFIEAIINSNTLPKIQFQVVGNDVLVNQVSAFLRFLNVQTYSLDLKI